MQPQYVHFNPSLFISNGTAETDGSVLVVASLFFSRKRALVVKMSVPVVVFHFLPLRCVCVNLNKNKYIYTPMIFNNSVDAHRHILTETSVYNTRLGRRRRTKSIRTSNTKKYKFTVHYSDHIF